MDPTEAARPRGLRLHDLVGLVVGYGMAALLARSFWPRNRPLAGVPAVALGLEFLWLGLAMSGPVVLLLDPRGPPPPELARPGRAARSPGPSRSSRAGPARPNSPGGTTPVGTPGPSWPGS